MVLIAVVFCALGTAIGSLLQDMQGFQLVMNFLVMPIFFLSGALFPLGNLPAAAGAGHAARPAHLRRRRPARGSVRSGPLQFLLDAGLLAVVAALFLAFGAWSFSRIQL